MDRRDLLKLLGSSAPFAGLSPAEVEALLTRVPSLAHSCLRVGRLGSVGFTAEARASGRG